MTDSFYSVADLTIMCVDMYIHTILIHVYAHTHTLSTYPPVLDTHTTYMYQIPHIHTLLPHNTHTQIQTHTLL